MHGAVIAKFLGKMIPLATRAKPVEHSVQHTTQRYTLSVLRASGVAARKYLLDNLPHVIGYEPDRGFWWPVGIVHAMVSCE